MSGKRADRPKLAEALKLCGVHGATLIIAKLDRLARNLAFISNLMDAGVDFQAVDFPQANRLTVHILAAASGLCRALRRDRSKSAGPPPITATCVRRVAVSTVASS